MRYLLAALLLLTACGGPPADTLPASEKPDTAGVLVPDVLDTADVAGAECPVAEPCPECSSFPAAKEEAFTEHDLTTCFEDHALGFLLCPVHADDL